MKQGKILKCNNCSYEWEYNGESEYYATCLRCLRKVKVNGKKACQK